MSKINDTLRIAKQASTSLLKNLSRIDANFRAVSCRLSSVTERIGAVELVVNHHTRRHAHQEAEHDKLAYRVGKLDKDFQKAIAHFEATQLCNTTEFARLDKRIDDELAYSTAAITRFNLIVEGIEERLSELGSYDMNTRLNRVNFIVERLSELLGNLDCATTEDRQQLNDVSRGLIEHAQLVNNTNKKLLNRVQLLEQSVVQLIGHQKDTIRTLSDDLESNSTIYDLLSDLEELRQ